MIAAAAALSSCGGGASGPTVAIIAPDTVLRALGEACSGGEPYLYAHATAAWRVEDASSGKVISKGDLPEGKAIAAFNHDPGVPRVPTFCRFEVHANIKAGAKYRLILPEGPPRPFALERGRATVVLD
ncbi:hypothetical protein [Solirubrobacter soli]|uniref:hypothetical protein n=1 Tax=Solirubrobacter soli TaxID=363832 RepID=UPI0003FE4061|nr:hypothetical protein [Solirubrobacter soli]